MSMCPKCGSEEFISMVPNKYKCGSSDFRGRPGTFNQSDECKNSAYTPKYQRLFAKILLCQTGFDKQDLDDIVSIVKEDFKDNENNY